MGKQRHLSGVELLQMKAREHAYLVTAQRTTLLISLVIMYEKYGWDAEQLNDWVDAYEDVLNYYNESKDYDKRLHEWNDFFKEYAGIDILAKDRQAR